MTVARSIKVTIVECHAPGGILAQWYAAMGNNEEPGESDPVRAALYRLLIWAAAFAVIALLIYAAIPKQVWELTN